MQERGLRCYIWGTAKARDSGSCHMALIITSVRPREGMRVWKESNQQKNARCQSISRLIRCKEPWKGIHWSTMKNHPHQQSGSRGRGSRWREQDRSRKLRPEKSLFCLSQDKRSLMALARWVSADGRSWEPAERWSKWKPGGAEFKARWGMLQHFGNQGRKAGWLRSLRGNWKE